MLEFDLLIILKVGKMENFKLFKDILKGSVASD